MPPKIDHSTWEDHLPTNPFAEAKTWLVVASAGCGKTHETQRVISHLIETGVPATSIMYILYNKKPAEEFKDRFRLKGFAEEDMKWWGTHHSVARRIMGLSPGKILSGYKLTAFAEKYGMAFGERDEEEEDDEKTAWDEILSRLDKKTFDGVRDFDPEEMAMYLKFAEHETQTGELRHTRYLEKSLALRLIPPEIQYIFVDEGQDNGKIQFDWLEWCKGLDQIKGLMVVGDDKQAINGYKGGNASLFLSFGCERRVCLKKTYRCAPEVLEYANELAEPISERSPLTGETARGKGFVWHTFDLNEIIEDLREAVDAGKSVMMLTRNKVFIGAASRKLWHYGLPTERVLWKRLREITGCLKGIRERGTIRLDEFKILMKDDDKVKKGDLYKSFYFSPGSVGRVYHNLFDLEKHPEGAAAVFDLDSERGLEIEGVRDLGANQEFVDLLRGGSLKLEGINCDERSLAVFKELVRKYGWDFKGINLHTIHTAKGGEADIVVLLRDVAGRSYEAELDDEDNERRVWYVGASRAREGLIVSGIGGGRESTILV